MIRKQRNQCGGFTIVELMVAVAITSVLILGALTFFTSASMTSTLQRSVSGMNASGRFGLDAMARELRMAGYRDSNWTLGPLSNAIAATDGPAATGGDSVTVRYEGAVDCNFAPAVAGIVTNTYQVVNNALQCNGQAITDGIQEMQIYLGEDISNNGVANRLLAPGTAGLDMSRVVSIQIHLLVRTDGTNITSSPQAYFFDSADQAPVDDGRLRREYSVTVSLRNST